MKTVFDCIPCFINQSISAARRNHLSDAQIESLLRDVLNFLSTQDWQLPPPVLAREVQRCIRDLTGSDDPYYAQKQADTKTALSLLPSIEKSVSESEWPFHTAVQFSIAGNAIDFGAAAGWNPSVSNTFQNAVSNPLDTIVVKQLEQAVEKADTILFLLDNCGEIVFDQPLLRLIGPDKLTVAVRGAPTLNDATMFDAKQSGLTEQYLIISNGSDVPGTHIPDCSPTFQQLFHDADLIIAKGQGNYECLSTHTGPICFLFMVKCPYVAEQVGQLKGSYALCMNGIEPHTEKRSI